MTSINVKSLPLKEVFKDLADEFGVSVSKNCDDRSVEIPEELGEGRISGLDLGNGLGIIVYDCLFHQDTTINFVVDKVHPLKFLFCELGTLTHNFENGGVEHRLDESQNAIVASSSTNGHVLNFRKNSRTRFNSLEMNREVFEIQMDCELTSLDKDLEILFRDTRAENPFYYHGNYCLKLADLFIELDRAFESIISKKLFWEGCALHILNLQILQFQDKEEHTILRKTELKQVIAATLIIKNEITDYDTVELLAGQVGLNVFKLQSGFKYLYGSTVNEFVMDRRLDMARNLLEHSDNNISEIVDLVGLHSRSYFSKIFKGKYNISPSVFRKSKMIK